MKTWLALSWKKDKRLNCKTFKSTHISVLIRSDKHLSEAGKIL